MTGGVHCSIATLCCATVRKLILLASSVVCSEKGAFYWLASAFFYYFCRSFVDFTGVRTRDNNRYSDYDAGCKKSVLDTGLNYEASVRSPISNRPWGFERGKYCACCTGFWFLVVDRKRQVLTKWQLCVVVPLVPYFVCWFIPNVRLVKVSMLAVGSGYPFSLSFWAIISFFLLQVFVFRAYSLRSLI